MSDVRIRDILRWQLYGLLTAQCIGIGVALLGFMGDADSSYLRSILTGCVAVAAVFAGSTPITFSLLLLWARMARSASVIESNIFLRFVGLSLLGAVGNHICGMIFMLLVWSDRPTLNDLLFYDYSNPGWMIQRWWMLGYILAVIVPRIVIKSLRRPIRLAQPATA
ncbi:MAG: hypothetical protein ABJC26_10485 [Gemmatimonadaceae bacterium]